MSRSVPRGPVSMVRPTSGEDVGWRRCRALLAGQCRHARLRPGAAARGPVGRRRPAGRPAAPTPRPWPPSPPSTPAAAWPATSAACSPSAPARPASWPPSVPHVRSAAEGRRATAPPSWSPSSSAARSATPPPSSGCSGTTSWAASTWPRGFLDRRRVGRGRRRAGRRRARHWAAGVLPPLVRRELTGPFDRARSTAAPCRAAAGRTPALAELLDAVRELDAAGRAAWRAAVDEGRADHRPWATAMHEASWAAHVSGRTRDAGHRPAARRPGLPRRRLRPPRRRRRRLERRRRLRAGHGHGRPARRGVARRPPGALERVTGSLSRAARPATARPRSPSRTRVDKCSK